MRSPVLQAVPLQLPVTHAGVPEALEVQARQAPRRLAPVPPLQCRPGEYRQQTAHQHICRCRRETRSKGNSWGKAARRTNDRGGTQSKNNQRQREGCIMHHGCLCRCISCILLLLIAVTRACECSCSTTHCLACAQRCCACPEHVQWHMRAVHLLRQSTPRHVLQAHSHASVSTHCVV